MDGYAGKVTWCDCTVCLCSICTLGIFACISYCNYAKCARVRRNFYLLTDRRLIQYSILTTGASTQVRFQGMQDGERTEFELELRSWVLTSIHMYRSTQDWSCLACCGACPAAPRPTTQWTCT